jgi:hypothetical protein
MTGKQQKAAQCFVWHRLGRPAALSKTEPARLRPRCNHSVRCDGLSLQHVGGELVNQGPGYER